MRFSVRAPLEAGEGATLTVVALESGDVRSMRANETLRAREIEAA